MSLFDRPTTEVVIVVFAVVLGAGVLFSGAALFLIEVYRPEVDTSGAVTAVGQTFDVMIGLIIGFMAGRRPEHRLRRRPLDDDEPDD
jgi:hypothetical protein